MLRQSYIFKYMFDNDRRYCLQHISSFPLFKLLTTCPLVVLQPIILFLHLSLHCFNMEQHAFFCPLHVIKAPWIIASVVVLHHQAKYQFRFKVVWFAQTFRERHLCFLTALELVASPSPDSLAIPQWSWSILSALGSST